MFVHVFVSKKSVHTYIYVQLHGLIRREICTPHPRFFRACSRMNSFRLTRNVTKIDGVDGDTCPSSSPSFPFFWGGTIFAKKQVPMSKQGSLGIHVLKDISSKDVCKKTTKQPLPPTNLCLINTNQRQLSVT